MPIPPSLKSAGLAITPGGTLVSTSALKLGERAAPQSVAALKSATEPNPISVKGSDLLTKMSTPTMLQVRQSMPLSVPNVMPAIEVAKVSPISAIAERGITRPDQPMVMPSISFAKPSSIGEQIQRPVPVVAVRQNVVPFDESLRMPTPAPERSTPARDEMPSISFKPATPTEEPKIERTSPVSTATVKTTLTDTPARESTVFVRGTSGGVRVPFPTKDPIITKPGADVRGVGIAVSNDGTKQADISVVTKNPATKTDTPQVKATVDNTSQTTPYVAPVRGTAGGVDEPDIYEGVRNLPQEAEPTLTTGSNAQPTVKAGVSGNNNFFVGLGVLAAGYFLWKNSKK